jgi:multidrug resistance efflux pump
VFVTLDDRVTVAGVVESNRHLVLCSPVEKTLVAEIFVAPGADVELGAPILRFADLQNWALELEKKDQQVKLLLEKAATYERLEKQGAQSKLSSMEYRTQANTLTLEADALKKQVENLTLRAPFAGKITDILVTEYQSVAVGTPIAALSAMDGKVIRCFIPENRFSEVQVGQPVAIKSNLYNYLHYAVYYGEVKNFDSYATHATEQPSFETFIKIVNDNNGVEMLKVGSTASCDIIVARRPLYELFLKK